MCQSSPKRFVGAELGVRLQELAVAQWQEFLVFLCLSMAMG